MSIYTSNKYTSVYYMIVNRSIDENRKRSDGRIYEEHHIIPKSCGGTNDPCNLVFLTPKEHYVCHRLLPKMVNNRYHREKMVYALWCLINGNGRSRRYSPNGRTYQYIKEQQSEVRSRRMTGSGNHFYGRTHSDELKRRFKENNPARREDVRIKMSDSAKEKYRRGYKNHNAITGWSDETKAKISQSHTGKKIPDDVRLKMSQTRSNKVWVKKDGEKSRHIQKDHLDHFLSLGWCLGRHINKRQSKH